MIGNDYYIFTCKGGYLMAQAKNKPTIYRHGTGVVIPYNVHNATLQDEDGTEETFYEYAEITLDRRDLPPLTAVKNAIAQQLRADLQAHIYTHYDQGTQATIQAFHAKAQRQSLTDITAECEAIFDWIQQVLGYYDDRKQAVVNAADEDAAVFVNWNFEVNVPKPSTLKGWRGVKAMFP